MVDFNDLSPVQDLHMIGATTIPSANTIAPKTRFSLVTGNAIIQNITPPILSYHELILCFVDTIHVSDPAIAPGGNILTPANLGLSRADPPAYYMFCFDPRIKKYYMATGLVFI